MNGEKIKLCHHVRPLFLSSLVWIAAPGLGFSERPALDTLDSYVGEAMSTWDVPRLSLAIVKDGEVILAKGYGLRELGKMDQVDGMTIFSIGSCSKAFGATAVALLVEDGLVAELTAREGPIVFQLEHWHIDQFTATWWDMKFFFSFVINELGAVTELKLSHYGTFQRVSEKPYEEVAR